MDKLETKFCNISFSNPFILPSGIIQEIKDHKLAFNGGAGGVTLKSLTNEPREGNPIPRIIKYKSGILNSVGIRNPGLEKGKQMISDFIKSSSKPVIVSIFANRIDDFKKLAEGILDIKPEIIELNLSCPNVEDEFGTPLGTAKESSFNAVAAVKKITGKIPILAKLTPNIAGIAEMAKACEAAGADGITAINAVGPGMVIDIAKRKPVLGNLKGGVSGEGIKPIAVRCIYEIYEAVKIPILGMGGVYTLEDAVEFFMAGAALVGVGVACYFKGYKLYSQLSRELEEYMDKEGIKNLKEIIGAAHNK
jgi:dihydroorotate dehydrogenase (NAD+) catalytic subunit